jgi:hypothetical protein
MPAMDGVDDIAGDVLLTDMRGASGDRQSVAV